MKKIDEIYFIEIIILFQVKEEKQMVKFFKNPKTYFVFKEIDKAKN